MKKTSTVVALALFIILWACNGGAAPSTTAADDETAAKAAIDQGHQAFLDAMKANDSNALVALLTEDVVFYPPNQPIVTGKAAIKTWWDGIGAQFKTTDIAIADRTVDVGGDWGIERAAFTWTLAPVAGGAPVVDHGHFIAIYQRQPDGTWKLKHDLWNSSQPLPR